MAQKISVTNSKRVLILSTQGDAVQDDMIESVISARREIRFQTGLELFWSRMANLPAMQSAVAYEPCDFLVLATGWGEKAEKTVGFCRRVREQRPDARIVYLDSFDSTSSPFFGVLPHVDLYVKKQLLLDSSLYNAPLKGGFVFTDHLVEQRKWSIGNWYFGSRMPQNFVDRIVLGWNLGAAPRMARLLRRGRRLTRPWRRRPLDVFCRITLHSLDASDWYSKHRLEALRKLETLADDYRVLAKGTLPREGVRGWRYRWEMARSRIAFSPFGWGEICYRDFEAVCLGCLLVKPSVSHLRTEPDIFRGGETYVPVRWDLTDLEEKCRYYLQNPEEAERIIQNARTAYESYFARGGAGTAFARILTPSPRSSTQSR